jgi:thermitase
MSRLRRIKNLDVQVLRLPPGLDVEQAVNILNSLPEVAYAEPNYVLHALAPTRDVVDEFDQWGLTKIQVPEAWGEFGPDPPRILLATVDTGIGRTHTDLTANIWQNPGEIAGDSIDDDGNGYVDDTWGWDFRNNDNDPSDDQVHGTLVSSIAAGVKDDAGVAGVCP